MPDTYHDIESRITDAILELNKRENPNVAAVARQFEVPIPRLRNRWKGRKSKIESGGHNKALSEAQESALCQYLDNLAGGGPKARYKQLEQAANSLLRKGHTGGGKPPTVGGHWAARFLRRHPQHVVRKQKPLATERKNALKPETFQTHFEDYRAAKTEKGIHDEDIYNFDETWFRAGIGKDEWIITNDGTSTRLNLEDPNNWDYITSVECVGGGGDVIPNMLILSEKQHLKKQFEEKDLENSMSFAVSDSGYSNDEIGVQWLEHFDECTRKKSKGEWRMLIMDGASIHTNEEFVRVCYSKNILPFRLPPHTTHLLQPLNVVCSQLPKHYHSEVTNDKVQNGDYEFSKVEFLARITSVRSQAFSKNTIYESFRQTGLIPFNPEIVMQKLRDLSSPSSVPDLLPTPHTPSQLT